ncbi:cell division control protein 14, SIN component-domain-containing protein [Cladochytrium replicatum]|nr:cell division control protein 14, SIN component-domain-containing protein [Cladochytrium replicatum]
MANASFEGREIWGQWARVEGARRRLERELDGCMDVVKLKELQDWHKPLTALNSTVARLNTDGIRLYAWMLSNVHGENLMRGMLVILQHIDNELQRRHLDQVIEKTILEALSCIQVSSLLSTKCKLVLGSERAIESLLKFTRMVTAPEIVTAALETMVAILVDSSENMRAFERRNSVRKICTLLKSQGLPENIKLKCVEVLCVYLRPETSVESDRRRVEISTTEKKRKSVAAVAGEAFVNRLARLALIE